MGKKESGQDADPRLQRIRLLSTELDIQRQTALERTRTVETKAAFVAVVAGLIVTAYASRALDLMVGTPAVSTGEPVSTANQIVIAVVLPLAAALGAITAALVALVPRPIDVVSVGALVSRWVDTLDPPEQLEDYLLELKRAETESRDRNYTLQSRALRFGFYFTLASIALVVLAAVLEMMI